MVDKVNGDSSINSRFDVSHPQTFAQKLGDPLAQEGQNLSQPSTAPQPTASPDRKSVMSTDCIREDRVEVLDWAMQIVRCSENPAMSDGKTTCDLL
eukprot:6335353-Amphidinium_carterae.1